jgi:hypothetical protein
LLKGHVDNPDILELVAMVNDQARAFTPAKAALGYLLFERAAWHSRMILMNVSR